MHQNNNLLLDTIQRLIRRNAISSIKKIVDKTHHADLADIFIGLIPTEQIKILHIINDIEKSSQVLSELNIEIRKTLIEELFKTEENFLTSMLQEMEPDDLTDLISELPEKLSQKMLTGMKKEEKEGIQSLLGYDQNSAGGLMSTNYFSMNETALIGEAIEYLRTSEDVDMAFYLYVINDSGILVGVVSLRQLVISKTEVALKDIMVHDVISVNVHEDQEEVARTVARYNLLAVPVIDDSNKLEGIITVDDIIDVFSEETTEDILRIAGARENEYDETSLLKNWIGRIPSLIAVLIFGILSFFIFSTIYDYASTISYSVASFKTKLIFFLPIMIFMASNLGFQSSIVMARKISINSVNKLLFRSLMIKEILTDLILSAFYLIIILSLSLFQNGFTASFLYFSIVLICIHITVAVISIGIGVFSPIALNRLKQDPFIASGVIIATFLGMLTVAIHLFLGNALINIFG